MSDRKSMLNMIDEGMNVYDNRGDEVGTVEFIHFSEANGGEHTAAAAPPKEPVQSDPVDFERKIFGADNLPKELRERLLMHGFIRMDSAKLFGYRPLRDVRSDRQGRRQGCAPWRGKH